MTSRVGGTSPRGLVADQDLATALTNHSWEWRTRPFPHVVARQVFVATVYRRLVAAFGAILDGRESIAYNVHHDFVGLSLTPSTAGDLSLFLSQGWHDLVTGVFGIQTTGQITAGVHRHLPGGRSGFPHNDIAPERLTERSGPGEIVQHATPSGFRRGGGPTVRAIALIYYLNNGPWRPGCGGETGLFSNWDDPIERPVARIPPIDNSLLAFECSPYSYHSFLANRRRRDSVIVFFYRHLDEYVRLWGPDGLQQYAEGGIDAV